MRPRRHRALRWFFASIVLLLFLSCMPYSRPETPKPLSGLAVVLRNRAAYELDCPREGIEGRSLGGGTILVTGCGKEALYTERCATCEEYISGTGDYFFGRKPVTAQEPCRCAYSLQEPVRPRTASVRPADP